MNLKFVKFFENIAPIRTIDGYAMHEWNSFPSGHTMSAFGLSSLLALMAGPKSRKRVLVLALLAIAVGLSRIFLVQHFLVDVLAGALLGMGVSGFVWWLNGTPFFREKTWLDGKLRFPFWLKATNHA